MALGDPRDLGRNLQKWFGVVVLLGVLLVAGTLLPFNWVDSANLTMIYAIPAIAMTALTGYAGMASIGAAALMGIGAFTVALVPIAQNQLIVGVILAAAITAVVGFIIGLPSLRIGGLYLAVATLALQFLFSDGVQILEADENKLGGYVVPEPHIIPGTSFRLSGSTTSGMRTWFAVIVVVLGATMLFTRNLRKSRVGRAWLSIRELGTMAELFGVKVNKSRLSIFVATSVMCGVAGALFAYFNAAISDETFTVTLAVQFVAMMIIGGLGSISGAITGAGIVILLPKLFQVIVGGGVGNSWFAVHQYDIESGLYGLLIVVFLLFVPAGISTIWQDGRFTKWRKHA